MIGNSTTIDLRHDEETDTYRVWPSGHGSIGTDVILAIADLTGTDPLNMEPIADFVNVDVLDGLFRPDWQTEEAVTFDYPGFHITVAPSGEIILQSNVTSLVCIDHTTTEKASWST